MTIDIRAIRADEIEQARSLLVQNGWSHRVADKLGFCVSTVAMERKRASAA